MAAEVVHEDGRAGPPQIAHVDRSELEVGRDAAGAQRGRGDRPPGRHLRAQALIVGGAREHHEEFDVAEDLEASAPRDHRALAPREASRENHPVEPLGREPLAHEVHAAVEEIASDRLVAGLAAEREGLTHALRTWAAGPCSACT